MSKNKTPKSMECPVETKGQLAAARGEFKKYIDYLVNVGGSIETKKFDEDWSPVGPVVRNQLNYAKLTREEEGVIFLTRPSRWL